VRAAVRGLPSIERAQPRGHAACRSGGQPRRGPLVDPAATGARLMSIDHSLFDVSPAVNEALAGGWPVVALESTLITHGFAPPLNLEAARRAEAAVRAGGAEPATVAVRDGRLRIGLSDDELADL